MHFAIATPRGLRAEPGHGRAKPLELAAESGREAHGHDAIRTRRSPAPTRSTPTCGPAWARKTRPRAPQERFRPTRSTRSCSRRRAPDAIFMHCLPAKRGRGSDRRGDRIAAVGGLRSGRKPPARAEGAAADAAGVEPGHPAKDMRIDLMNKPKKVALAYSGGLDTSIIIPWLKENYGCEVVAVCGDIGQGGDELTGLEQKALQDGRFGSLRRRPARGVRQRVPVAHGALGRRLRAQVPARHFDRAAAARQEAGGSRAEDRLRRAWRTAAPARATTRCASS